MAAEYMGITESGRLEFAEAKEGLSEWAITLSGDGTLSLQEEPVRPSRMAVIAQAAGDKAKPFVRYQPSAIVPKV